MISKNFLWILPFIFFFVGYFATRSFFYTSQLTTPNVVGKHLYEAFVTLSHQQLTIQLLDQKEDPDLPEGTIIMQVPGAGQRVKPRQTIFLVLSKKQPLQIAPQLYGKRYAEIEPILRAANLRLKSYFIESAYPSNSCIAQIPPAGEPVSDKTIIAYFSKESKKGFIWPDFTGKPVQQVVEFLDRYNIKPHLSNAKNTDSPSVVKEQRPLAGTFITFDDKKAPIVQLFAQ